ncbi:uncharacterized protein LOC129894229 [Solanum dulcamara]|uniref:uncharacterized protein LOC129894229 n=1 Tax=Solanum dulcamara TaxID=45834 RepID=UPI002485B95A|nr:uncharacterized protein LOC129894229 [Solanum dulcamara]
MSTISATFFRSLFSIASPPPSTFSRFFLPTPLLLPKFRSCPYPLTSSSSSSPSRTTVSCSNSSEETEVSHTLEEWLQKLPDKTKPLYSHSLPCIEAWLRSLGFYQSGDDRALWFVENPDWQAQLSLDITELHIRYLKRGPGNLEKDVDRRFSYALSREDIENAILGGP